MATLNVRSALRGNLEAMMKGMNKMNVDIAALTKAPSQKENTMLN